MNLAHWNKISKDLKVANHKWWFNEDGTPTGRLDKTLGMLIVSEVAEAMEGVRKNLDDDHLPQFKMFDVELADTMIRSLDWGIGNGFEVVDVTGTIGYDSFVKELSSKANKTPADDLYDLVILVTNLITEVAQWKEAVADNRIPEDALTSSTYLKMVQHSYSMLIHGIQYVADKHGVDLETIVDAKIAYNAVRPDHKRENRDKENGKKF